MLQDGSTKIVKYTDNDHSFHAQGYDEIYAKER